MDWNLFFSGGQPFTWYGDKCGKCRQSGGNKKRITREKRKRLRKLQRIARRINRGRKC